MNFKIHIFFLFLLILVPFATCAEYKPLVLRDGKAYFCTWQANKDEVSPYPYMVEIGGDKCNGDVTSTKRCTGIGMCFRKVGDTVLWAYQMAHCGLPPTLTGNCGDWSFVDCAKDPKVPDTFYSREEQQKFSESLKAHADSSERAAVHFTSK